MKKKFISLLTVICLCIGLGGTVFADFVITSDRIYVSDGQGADYDSCFHPMNADISGKGWSWEASSKTMTLDNFQGQFDFEAVTGPLTVNLVLNAGTENNVSMGIDMWTESGGPCTLAIKGQGKLNVNMGNVNADVLDISEADVVIDGYVPCIVMRSGSLTAEYCHKESYPDAYYGGSISLTHIGEEAFYFYAGDGETSAFADVPATDAEGNALTFGSYDVSGSKYMGYLNADGTPASTVRIVGAGSAEPSQPSQPASPTGFGDVSADAYYADAVKWAVDRSITNGTADGIFSPDQTCTRAQIITFLWRAAGSPEPSNASAFSDVNADAYYAKATAWAAENGMVSGASFSPDDPCTREMAVEFMWKHAGSPDAAEASFADVSSDAVNWAVETGVTNGTSDTAFSPDQTCTRAQIVTFLYRAFSK